MAGMGFKPGAARWQAQTNPLSYGGNPTQLSHIFIHFGGHGVQTRGSKKVGADESTEQWRHHQPTYYIFFTFHFSLSIYLSIYLSISLSLYLSIYLSICFQNVSLARISVTSKQSPNVYKNLPKNDFTRKIKDFDNFTKIAQKCWQFGQNNCCHML